MPLTNSQYDEIMRGYQERQLHNQHLMSKRKSDAYAKIPRFKEIDEAIAKVSVQQARKRLEGDQNALNTLHAQIASYRAERRELLAKHGYPDNYFEPVYTCMDCKDTGYILCNGKTLMCSCLRQKLLNSKYNNSNIGNLENENFKKFNISLYSDEINEEKYGEKISPRENIKFIVKAIKKFIKDFDNPTGKNLLFSGGTGLGKTFLSNCIVAELLPAR